MLTIAEGFRVTKKYLIVGFMRGQGTTVRYCEVRVPLEDLVLSESFSDALDRACRRLLLEKWSGVEIPDDIPLF